MSDQESTITANIVNELIKNERYGHLISLYLKKDPTK